MKQYVKKNEIKIILPNDCLEARFFSLIAKLQDRIFQGIHAGEFIKEQYNNKKSFLKQKNMTGGRTGLNGIYNKCVDEIFNKEEKDTIVDYVQRYSIIPHQLVRDLGDKRIQVIGALSSDDLSFRYYMGLGYRVRGIYEPKITHLNNKVRVIDNTNDIDHIYNSSEPGVMAYYNSLFQEIKQQDILLEEKTNRVCGLIEELDFNQKEKLFLIKSLINDFNIDI